MEAIIDLRKMFLVLKAELMLYAPPLAARVNQPGRYELWSPKEAVIAGRKRSEVYFAAIIIQKDYVGFYFMPVYAAPEMKTVFGPELLALLKGKSCFHIRRLDPRLLRQIRAALKKGCALYKSRGWV
jgi:hypothetical protein